MNPNNPLIYCRFNSTLHHFIWFFLHIEQCKYKNIQRFVWKIWQQLFCYFFVPGYFSDWIVKYSLFLVVTNKCFLFVVIKKEFFVDIQYYLKIWMHLQYTQNAGFRVEFWQIFITPTSMKFWALDSWFFVNKFMNF